MWNHLLREWNGLYYLYFSILLCNTNTTIRNSHRAAHMNNGSGLQYLGIGVKIRWQTLLILIVGDNSVWIARFFINVHRDGSSGYFIHWCLNREVKAFQKRIQTIPSCRLLRYIGTSSFLSMSTYCYCTYYLTIFGEHFSSYLVDTDNKVSYRTATAPYKMRVRSYTVSSNFDRDSIINHHTRHTMPPSEYTLCYVL